jgi:hypothetical protein
MSDEAQRLADVLTLVADTYDRADAAAAAGLARWLSRAMRTGPETAIAAVVRVFPGATTGSDLVPGVPGRVLDLAEQLEVMASGMAAADQLLQGASTSGWHGAAAEACVQLMRSMPQPYAASARAMRSAAGCVAAHATVLGAAQRDADDAVGLDLRATAAQPPDPSSADVARTVALQQQARDLVTAASTRVRGSAAEAADALRAAAAVAPDRPGQPAADSCTPSWPLQKELQLGGRRVDGSDGHSDRDLQPQPADRRPRRLAARRRRRRRRSVEAGRPPAAHGQGPGQRRRHAGQPWPMGRLPRT